MKENVKRILLNVKWERRGNGECMEEFEKVNSLVHSMKELDSLCEYGFCHGISVVRIQTLIKEGYLDSHLHNALEVGDGGDISAKTKLVRKSFTQVLYQAHGKQLLKAFPCDKFSLDFIIKETIKAVSIVMRDVYEKHSGDILYLVISDNVGFEIVKEIEGDITSKQLIGIANEIIYEKLAEHSNHINERIALMNEYFSLVKKDFNTEEF